MLFASVCKGWSECCDVFLLSLVSDNATANIKMFKWLSRFLPANGLVVRHGCNGKLAMLQCLVLFILFVRLVLQWRQEFGARKSTP